MTDSLGYGKKELVKTIVKTHWDLDNPADKQYTYNDLLFIVQELLYDEGKAYFEDMKQVNTAYFVYKRFVEYLLARNLANYDSMVLMTSEKGTGKSSAAITLAREWCRLIGIRFDPARHIAYTNADVVNRIQTLNAFEPLIADEAVKFACLDEKTKIKIFENNKIVEKTIKELEGQKNIPVLSYNKKHNCFEKAYAEKCLKTKTDYVYEIETENGQKIRATKEHMFFCVDGKYRRLNELREGDKIVAF